MTTENTRTNQREEQDLVETSNDENITIANNNLENQLERVEVTKTSTVLEPPIPPVASNMEHASMLNTELGTAVATTDVHNSSVHEDPGNGNEASGNEEMDNPEIPDQVENENIEGRMQNSHISSQREQMLLDEMKRLREEVRAKKVGFPDSDSPSSSSSEESEDSDTISRRRRKKRSKLKKTKSKRKKIYKRNLGKISLKDKDVNGKLLFLVRRVRRLRKRYESDSLMEAIECSLDYEVLQPLVNIMQRDTLSEFIRVVEEKCNSPVNMEQDELELSNPEPLDDRIGWVEGVLRYLTKVENFNKRCDTLEDGYEDRKWFKSRAFEVILSKFASDGTMKAELSKDWRQFRKKMGSEIETSDIREFLFDASLSFMQRRSVERDSKINALKENIELAKQQVFKFTAKCFKCGNVKELSRREKFYCNCNLDVVCWCNMKHAPKYHNEAISFLQRKLDRDEKLRDLLKNFPTKPSEHGPHTQGGNGGAASRNMSFMKQLSQADVSLGIDVRIFNRVSWGMCDTGSEITAISGRMYRNILKPQGFAITPGGMRTITTADGKRSAVSGSTILPVVMGKEV